MDLNTLKTELETLENECRRAIAEAAGAAALDDVERKYLGKSGALKGMLSKLGSFAKEQRAEAGKLTNETAKRVDAELANAKEKAGKAALDAALEDRGFDITIPGPVVRAGSLHPLTRVRRELEDLFVSMGYAVLEGPEVELEKYNFDDLNIPADHPARESHDTFWTTTPGLCLRTHTSPVQVRGMRWWIDNKFPMPMRAIAPGRVFRNETVDASHEHTFHQMEGIVIDEKPVSIAHLLHSMKTLLRGIFGRELEVRLRPGFFPFVEPGFELDARCLHCEGKGCPFCKHSGWVELLPCGLVHPNVIQSGGFDPEKHSGFAFGLGLSRLVCLRHGVDDVRHLLSGDVRFLRSFC
ncbi:MAG: phenylalanine--tRNA ligase subunit alpha [Planctomycetes bacterium]|nr:phenylalanine--tRNA ligase subunit alpha [Planctomycetota bacterium]